MNKVVYITIFALTPQIERYLFIQDAVDSGLEVEYWDLKNIYFKGRPFENTISRKYVRRINSFEDLKTCFKREDLERTIFVLQVYFEWRVLSLYVLMTRLKCKMVSFPFDYHEPKLLAVRIWEKIRYKLFTTEFFRSILNRAARIFKKIGLVKDYDLVFAAGQLTRDVYKGRCKKVVNINYADYDRYQQLKARNERIVSGEYCLFLDEGCVNNPTVKILEMDELDPGKFFGALNRFFCEIEKKFGVKVVIAAHPGIQYDKSVFARREIYEGKTCELVKDCKFVISQSSTSISFAVLYNKPAVFVYTDEYVVKRYTGFKILEFLASSLGAKSYNMDSKEATGSLEVPRVDPILYENYKYRSLTSRESENELSRDIVVRTLREF